MIFGRKKIEEFEEEEEEYELVMFQGAFNGKDVNLAKNARLAEAGLIPAKELVTDALLRRAHTLRLDPKGGGAVIRMLVDGIPYPGGRLPKQQALAVTQMIKLLAGLDVRERSKPQSGGINAELDETRYQLTVKTAPVEGGAERLFIHCRKLGTDLEKPEDLGFSEELRSRIRERACQKHGVVIVCGSQQTGVTTSMFGTLRSIDSYMYTIYSMADPQGRDLGHINQFEDREGEDLETALLRTVRMEGDVIFLDPLRDEETAKVMFESQKNITLMCELTAKDTAHGIAQLVKLAGDPQAVAEGLELILSPRLLRVLCTDCKEAYRPNPKLIAKVGLPKNTKILYRPPRPPEEPVRGEEFEPCTTCGGLGFFGRTAMIEAIEMTDEMRQVVAQGGDPSQIKTQARKEKMDTFQSEGLRLVSEGRTTLEELQRIFKG